MKGKCATTTVQLKQEEAYKSDGGVLANSTFREALQRVIADLKMLLSQGQGTVVWCHTPSKGVVVFPHSRSVMRPL